MCTVVEHRNDFLLIREEDAPTATGTVSGTYMGLDLSRMFSPVEMHGLASMGTRVMSLRIPLKGTCTEDVHPFSCGKMEDASSKLVDSFLQREHLRYAEKVQLLVDRRLPFFVSRTLHKSHTQGATGGLASDSPSAVAAKLMAVFAFDWYSRESYVMLDHPSITVYIKGPEKVATTAKRHCGS